MLEERNHCSGHSSDAKNYCGRPYRRPAFIQYLCWRAADSHCDNRVAPDSPQARLGQACLAMSGLVPFSYQRALPQECIPRRRGRTRKLL